MDRENIPEVLGDDVGDEEVDLFAGVNAAGVASAGVNAVGADAYTRCGLDLHARQAAREVEDEVVAVAVTPGFGNAETEGGGFVEEGGFRDLSATLAVELWLGGNFSWVHGILPGGARLQAALLWRNDSRSESFRGSSFLELLVGTAEALP